MGRKIQIRNKEIEKIKIEAQYTNKEKFSIFYVKQKNWDAGRIAVIGKK